VFVSAFLADAEALPLARARCSTTLPRSACVHVCTCARAPLTSRVQQVQAGTLPIPIEAVGHVTSSIYTAVQGREHRMYEYETRASA
jgi:hypothetical protein